LALSSEPSGSRSKKEAFEMSTLEAVKDVGSSPRPTPITLAIYRDLRAGMVVIMVMLAAALVIDTISATHPQSTLSAYYYTSAHSIFIAALLALSTLFFVYRGSSDTEDALLTLAGVCALVAALVPQGRPYPVRESFLPQDYNVKPVIQPNVWAVVIALVLGWLLMWWQHRNNDTQPIRSAGGTLSLYFLRLVVLLGVIALVVPPLRHYFLDCAHGIAGVLMLSAFIVTVFHAAYLVGREEESPHRRRYQLFYWVIAVVMAVTLIAVITAYLAHPQWELWGILIESALILEFAAYWVGQTIELWDSPDRRERLPEDARNRLAERLTTRGPKGLKSALVEARNDRSGPRLLRLL
jgi:hypothetical protein